jgi:soluble lytic murein transglycosylase-like protein
MIAILNKVKILWKFSTLLIAIGFSGPAIATDAGYIKDSQISFGSSELVFPEILSHEDTMLYRSIFNIQETGNWKEADALISSLEDKTLVGHVLAQRYLHPTKYRSRYKELKAWMAKYADHPDALRLYKLARMRQPKNYRAPKRPISVQKQIISHRGTVSILIPSRKLSHKKRQRVRVLKRIIRSRLRRGFTLSAKQHIKSKEIKQLFSDAEYDQAKARLGQGYFLAGRDAWALMWAGEAAARSGHLLPEAHWTAGLAAWRLKKIDVAAKHFESIANNENVSAWLSSAGAFWAARAHLINRQPELVNPYLIMASKNIRTFYGLIANHILGQPTNFRWAIPPLGEETLARLKDMPRGRRAMALLQVGENRRAERELKVLGSFADKAITEGILALASRGPMPSLAVRIDKRLFPNGGGYDGAAYPLPGWLPKDGLRVDRALIYAMIRQESRFNPKAKSWAGARGLMQLMPRTASFVAQDRRFHRQDGTRRTLFQPEVNLELGQKYIEILLADENIKGNLFFMATAWNGGPGNLIKWRRKTEYMDDALFFIESIPSLETRIFIEKVLSNLWIYRDQLGQPSPSLAAIAAGQWPLYVPLGQEPSEVAEIDRTQ